MALNLTRRRLLAAGGAVAAMGGLASCAGTEYEPFDDAEVRESYPPIGQFVTVDGYKVHYWEKGEGQPVVLVHGASGNLRDWTFSIADRLAEDYRVIAFDRPGLGYTDRPPQGWDPFVQAALLRGATKALGAERPILVGHSWGGALVMAWAIDDPEGVKGAVPVSGVTIPYGGMARVANFVGLDRVVVNAYSEYLLESARTGGVRSFIARVFRPQPIPSGYIEYVGAPLALRASTLRANAEDLSFINSALIRMEREYPSLGVPVEIVHGRADFIDWDDHAEPLAALLPNARLTVLPGVGHMAHHAGYSALEASIGRLAEA